MKNILVILGNGFDKKCGLKSSFSDFFKIHKEKIENIYPKIGFNNINTNVWYLLFYYRFYAEANSDRTLYSDGKILIEGRPFIKRVKEDDILWMDIESLIKEVLFGRAKYGENNYDRYDASTAQPQYIEVLEKLLKSHLDVSLQTKTDETSILQKNIKLRNQKNLNIEELLFDELKEFEADFKNYLSNEIGPDYLFKTKNLLFQLCRDDEDLNLPVYVLTFNYTSPKLQINRHRINHIHGCLADDEIVIGYDSSDINLVPQDKRIFLSKVAQKTFNNIESLDTLPKRDEVCTIRFFGHSLGEQDYSYFHAIFDIYDIYDTDIKLQFFYSEYEGSNGNERSKTISRVCALLNNYSLRSGRERDYKTLISKLLLEGRLTIEKI